MIAEGYIGSGGEAVGPWSINTNTVTGADCARTTAKVAWHFSTVGHGGRLRRALNNVGVVFQANIGDYAFLVGEPFGHLLGCYDGKKSLFNNLGKKTSE